MTVLNANYVNNIATNELYSINGKELYSPEMKLSINIPENTRILFIGEEHNDILAPKVLTELLPSLWKQGFRTLFMESGDIQQRYYVKWMGNFRAHKDLTQLRREIENDYKIPINGPLQDVLSTGGVEAEIELIYTAISLGFYVTNYDTHPQTVEELINETRDQVMAKNLLNFLQGNYHNKAIVYTGMYHAQTNVVNFPIFFKYTLFTSGASAANILKMHQVPSYSIRIDDRNEASLIPPWGLLMQNFAIIKKQVNELYAKCEQAVAYYSELLRMLDAQTESIYDKYFITSRRAYQYNTLVRYYNAIIDELNSKKAYYEKIEIMNQEVNSVDLDSIAITERAETLPGTYKFDCIIEVSQ